MRLSQSIRRAILTGAAFAAISSVYAEQVSPPVTLQWFESSWKTIERRTPDLFGAGYGSLWTPPPGRAVYLPEGGGIGYDPYDRFDLGKPRDPTLYGTEGSYKSAIQSVRKMGGNVYVDFVHHHLGSLDMDFNGNTYPPNVANQGSAFPHFGNQVPFLRHHADYPGFEVTTPGVFKNSGSSYRDTYSEVGGPAEGDAEYQYWFRLRGATGSGNLITLDLANNRMLVRNPVPGHAQNVPQSSTSWQFPTTTINNGVVGPDLKYRQANTPDANNARFYPDQQGSSHVVKDGGVNYTIYDFNNANPMAGDPVAESSLGYMMRYAQWMTQAVGVDGLRIDAARHVPLGVYNSWWNPNSLNVPNLIDRATAGASNRLNLDGTRRNIFQFQEIFSYNKDLLKSFIRKSQPSGDTVNPNRDVLDFSMWEAMALNMGSNGSSNDWFSIRSASVNAGVYNTLDPNIANNGDNGIGFVYNHDEGISPPGTGGTIALDNVAHAWILMRPGNAYVFYRGNEFDRTGNTRFFLKNGRGDAMGGQYGSIITTLLDVRNSYGRGNFIERWIDNAGPNNEKLANSAIYVFERQGSAVVGLNIGYNPNVALRNDIQTSFVAGTHLEEVTGNWQDPSGLVPRTVTVDSTGKVDLAIPWNNSNNGNKGYVVYGLPRPRGSMSLSNVSQTLADPAPTPTTNGTARINSIDVITANSFTLTLNTSKVTLSDGFHDSYADGDRALFKIDDGFDANGNGSPDNPSSLASNATKYGFESFSSNEPGYDANPANSGTGSYSQTINTTNLSEGYHYITARAWRKQGTNESEVYTDFRRTIYVDRLAPVSAVDSTAQMPYQSNDRARDIRVKSTDGTADNVHIFFDLPAALSDADVLNLVAGGTGQGTWLDSGVWGKEYTNVGSGNHVVTSVTYEISGNKSIQRFVGNYIGTSRGLGLGDTNYDQGYGADDVTNFEGVLYSLDTQFNAASDLNGDGRVNTVDLFALPGRYASVMANNAFVEAKNAIKRRGDFTGNYTTFANVGDIDNLSANLGSTLWKYDLDSSGGPANASDLRIMVYSILGTEFGDANVDGKINTVDFNSLAGNFGLNSGAVWSQGNFNVDGKVDSTDFNVLLSHYGYSAPLNASGLGAIVPEPGSLTLVGLGWLLRRRR